MLSVTPYLTYAAWIEEGMAILYISHKLDEIKALCKNATIFRHGEKIDSVVVADQTPASLAGLMMGEELKLADHATTSSVGEVRLQVENLNLPAESALGISLRDINFEVRGGEIVGLAGVAGNGQDELLKALNGELRSENESIWIEGSAVGQMGPNERRVFGLVSVPEKRLGHGAVPGMSLVDNAFLTANLRLGLIKLGVINYPKTVDYAQSVIEQFDVRTPDEDVSADSLSGGNLQKFIVGREINQSPELIVVAQPTWGVDAGAAQSIRAALRALANQGTAVLVISQDLDELIEMSDRIGAICAGKVSQLFPIDEMNSEKIGLLMAGVAL